jgi:hypothetical protein
VVSDLVRGRPIWFSGEDRSEASMSQFYRLAKADPGNAGWQRDLSVLNERLGDVYLAQGNLPDALEQYRASLIRMIPIRDADASRDASCD